MKVIPIALASNIQSGTSSWIFIWKIRRRDGAVFGFTSHDRDIIVDGLVYKASSGFDMSQITTGSDMSVDNMQVNGFIDDSFITEYDILTRKWDYAEVWLSRVNWRKPADGFEKMRYGKLGEASPTKTKFALELLGLMQALQQEVGRLFEAACDANLGDSRCKVNLASFTVTGTVTSGDGYTGFIDLSRAEAARRFTYGKLTFTSGANAGMSMEVKSFEVGGVFELQEAMPGLISVGDTYSVYAGCNKIRDGDCLNKFNNSLNHRGFPVKPTEDQVASGT